jgi:hypothetical protein
VGLVRVGPIVLFSLLRGVAADASAFDGPARQALIPPG